MPVFFRRKNDGFVKSPDAALRRILPRPSPPASLLRRTLKYASLLRICAPCLRSFKPSKTSMCFALFLAWTDIFLLTCRGVFSMNKFIDCGCLSKAFL